MSRQYIQAGGQDVVYSLGDKFGVVRVYDDENSGVISLVGSHQYLMSEISALISALEVIHREIDGTWKQAESTRQDWLNKQQVT